MNPSAGVHEPTLSATTAPYGMTATVDLLDACNPPMAHRALTEERNIGLLLPCNVVVYAADEAEKSIVAIIDPEVSLGRVGSHALAPLAADVKARLRRVLDAVITPTR